MQIIHKLLSREMFFLLSVVIYALLSDLAPKKIGISEILLVFFLIASLRINFSRLQKFYLNEKFYILFLIILFLICLFFTKFNNPQFVRDYIGFFFMFLPYIFLHFFDMNKKNVFLLPIILTIGGLLICYYKVFYLNFIIDGKISFKFVDLKYNYNDTLIIFSLNFLIFYSFLKINGFKKIIFLLFAFTTYLNLIEFGASAGTKSYLINFIYVVLISLIYLINPLVKNNIFLKFKNIKLIKNNLNIFIIIIIFLILVSLYIIGKENFTTLMNSRNVEIDYFIDYLNSNNFIDLLFGKGLGSIFIIKFSDDLVLTMGFVHNFLIYLILKVGLIGSFILFIYFNRIFYIHKISIISALKNILLTKDNIVFNSSFMIILGSIIFYTSFKHLSFWLIMSALCVDLSLRLRRK